MIRQSVKANIIDRDRQIDPKKCLLDFLPQILEDEIHDERYDCIINKDRYKD